MLHTPLNVQVMVQLHYSALIFFLLSFFLASIPSYLNTVVAVIEQQSLVYLLCETSLFDSVFYQYL